MVKFWRGRNIILAGGTMLAGIFGAQAVSADNSGISFTVSVPDVPVLEISVYDEDGNLMVDGQETLMEVTPTMALAGFNTTGMKVTVGTSSAAGYKLAMQVANDGTLVSENSDVIPSLASDEDESGNKFTCTMATAASCNFTVNSWGYWMTGDEANAYKPVPSVQTQLVNYTAGATDGEDTDFAFAVRANAKQAAGDYETTINFIATANPETTIHSLQYMQDFNVLVPDEYAAVVESMKEGQAYELTDTRDGATESYQVAKLEDGNVWMLDNLRLGKDSIISLTSSDTNLPSGTTFVLPEGTAGGFNSYTGAKINVASKNNVPSKVYGTQGSGKIGVYYNYAAASAGKINTSSNSSDGDPNQDICPAGWRLPTGGPSGEFQTLCDAVKGSSCSNGDAYANALKLRDVLNIPLSGYYYNSSAQLQGSGGYGGFWSSTRLNDTDMYFLRVDASRVYSQYNSSRDYGYSVRCVLKSNENNVAINFNGNGATSGKNRTLGYKAGFATLPNATSLGFEVAGFRGGFTTWNTKADGSGTSYTAGTTITAEMNGLTLYAQWQEATLAMQDADSTSLGNLLTNNGDITYLYDSRDDNIYTIGKLNGKYWMLDNLRLDPATLKTTLATSNTNMSPNVAFTLPASSTADFTDDTTNYENPHINTESKNSPQSYGNGSNKIGVYYNYCAASAGTYCKPRGSGSGNASYDICPAGWRMPTGGSSGEYKALYNQYNNYANFKNAFHASPSGVFRDGLAGVQGRYGYFWSSTCYSSTSMYYLSIDTTTVYPQTGLNRYYGYSVRCVYGG